MLNSKTMKISNSSITYKAIECVPKPSYSSIFITYSPSLNSYLFISRKDAIKSSFILIILPCFKVC